MGHVQYQVQEPAPVRNRSWGIWSVEFNYQVRVKVVHYILGQPFQVLADPGKDARRNFPLFRSGSRKTVRLRPTKRSIGPGRDAPPPQPRLFRPQIAVGR